MKKNSKSQNNHVYDEKVINGKTHVTGIIHYSGLTATYTGVIKPSQFRGKIRLLSPATGKVLECVGEERRKRLAQRKDKTRPVYAEAELRCYSTEQASIKAEAENHFRKLIANNSAALQLAYKAMSVSQADTLPDLVQRYGKLYLGEKRLAESSYQSQTYALKNGAARFAGIPLEEIDERAIRKAMRKPKGTSESQQDEGKKTSGVLTDQQFNLLKDFWNWCNEHYSMPSNPFERFQKTNRHSKSRDGAALARERGVSKNLFPTEEKAMNRKIIAMETTDGMLISIPLIKDAGLNSSMCCDLVWGDVVLDPDDLTSVIIRIRRHFSSATTNYSRHGFPFLAIMMHKVYAELRKRYSEDQLAKRHVIEKDGRKAQTREVTHYVRKTLLDLGVSYQSFQAIRKDKSKNGAGVEYLLRTYEYKLRTQIGLALQDPAAIKFAQGRSLSGDVTADHYRSLSCPEGLYKQHIALLRFGTGLEKDSRKASKKTEKLDDGTVEVCMKPENTALITETKMVVLLRPGESIRVYNDCGVSGEFICYDADGEEPEDLPNHHYYEIQQEIETQLALPDCGGEGES